MVAPLGGAVRSASAPLSGVARSASAPLSGGARSASASGIKTASMFFWRENSREGLEHVVQSHKVGQREGPGAEGGQGV